MLIYYFAILYLAKYIDFLFFNAKKCKTATFSWVFHPKISTFFLVKSKLSTAKKCKIATFSRIFHPKNSTLFPVKSGLSTAKKCKTNFFTKKKFDRFDNIFWEIKVEFLDKKLRYQTVCVLKIGFFWEEVFALFLT